MNYRNFKAHECKELVDRNAPFETIAIETEKNHSGGTMSVPTDEGWNVQVEIQYCPFCGKKLFWEE